MTKTLPKSIRYEQFTQMRSARPVLLTLTHSSISVCVHIFQTPGQIIPAQYLFGFMTQQCPHGKNFKTPAQI